MTINNQETKKIADVMSEKTPWEIEPGEVTKINNTPRNMAVYATQKGDITILCLITPDGLNVVQYVSW